MASSIKVTEINRFNTAPKGTITRLNYVSSVKALLVSEAAMFGFDWTGKARIIPEADLLAAHEANADYENLAYSSIEYEYGASTTEYFVLPNGTHFVVAGCMDGAMYSLKLKPDQPSGKLYKLPIFKIESSNKEATGVEGPYEEVLYEHSDIVSKIAKNPWLLETFCSVSWDGTAQFWTFKESTIEYVASINIGKPIYDTLWFNQDLTITAGGTMDKGIIAQTDLRAKTATKVFESDCTSRAVSRVGEYLLATTWDSGDVAMIDLRVNTKPVGLVEPIMYKGNKVRPHALDILHTHGWLLIGYDHFAKIWDIGKGAEVWRNAVAESDAVNALAAVAGSAFVYSTMAGIISVNRIDL